MSLTDITVKNLRPFDRAKKYADGDGLYLYIAPSGLKSWRFNHGFQGTQSTMTFGTYPLVSLKQARDQLVDAKRLFSLALTHPPIRKFLKMPIRPRRRILLRPWPESGSSARRLARKSPTPAGFGAGPIRSCCLF
ncbi:MAG: Arm DNA-binding domain-containing protein [Deltaproteobacteria bacterium]|nr:Arm DNA-binding domain-containing protein [Deltaproteobacteria bacterium]